MSSPSTRRRGSFASRRCFIAPTRTGATAPIFRAPTAALTPGEVLRPFIAQFYAERPPPKLILLSHEVEEADWVAALWQRSRPQGRDSRRPSAAKRSEMVADASNNAREALGRRLADSASQKKLLEALGAAFGMDKPPRRVEVYDNSHIMGSAAIGAMIVAGPQGFMKTHYRTFNIKSELDARRRLRHDARGLSRRFFRLLKEEGEAAPRRTRTPFRRPDLILIDGGRGQFEAARPVAGGTGRDGRDVASIAKGADRNAGREMFFVDGARAVPAGAARSGALFRAAPARRGASLRHRHAPGQAQEGICEKSARRDRRHRPVAQEGPVAGVRHRKSGGGRRRWPISKRRRASPPPPRRLVFDHFHEKG